MNVGVPCIAKAQQLATCTLSTCSPPHQAMGSDELPFSYSPKIKSHIPLAIKTMGARISREGQPQGSNTKPQHSTPWMWVRVCRGWSHQASSLWDIFPNFDKTWVLICENLHRITCGLLDFHPSKTIIYPRWFPSIILCRNYPLMQHHSSPAIVLGQTTWSTEGKMRLIKRKKVKPFIKFKSSVLQLSEVMSHSHLNSFLQD